MAKRRFDLLPLPLPRQVRPNDTRKSKGRKDRRERETERMTKWTNDNSEGGGRREEWCPAGEGGGGENIKIIGVIAATL